MLARSVTWLLLLVTLAAPGVCCCSLAAAVDAVAACVRASSPPPSCPGCVGRRTLARETAAALGAPRLASAQPVRAADDGGPAVGGETPCGCRCHEAGAASAPRTDRSEDRGEAPAQWLAADVLAYVPPASHASREQLAGRPPSPTLVGGRALLARLQRLLI